MLVRGAKKLMQLRCVLYQPSNGETRFQVDGPALI